MKFGMLATVYDHKSASYQILGQSDLHI